MQSISACLRSAGVHTRAVMVRLGVWLRAGKRWLAINAVPLSRRVAAWVGPAIRRGTLRLWRGLQGLVRNARPLSRQAVRHMDGLRSRSVARARELAGRCAVYAQRVLNPLARWIAVRWRRGQAWLDARQRERIRALLPVQATVDPAGLRATGTRVDVGSWFGPGRVWMVWTGETLGLAAAGKRPLAACLDRAALKDSVYNHITGELLLRPAPEAVVRNLKIDPLTARRLLDAAGHSRKEHCHA